MAHLCAKLANDEKTPDVTKRAKNYKASNLRRRPIFDYLIDAHKLIDRDGRKTMQHVHIYK